MVTPTAAHLVRMALASSPRWTEAVKDLPILALADHEPIHPEWWDEDDRTDVIKWANGEMSEMPKVLNDWLWSVVDRG